MFDSENYELVQKTLANHGYQIDEDDSSDERISADRVGTDDYLVATETGVRDKRYTIMTDNGEECICTSFDEMYTAMMRIILSDSR